MSRAHARWRVRLRRLGFFYALAPEPPGQTLTHRFLMSLPRRERAKVLNRFLLPLGWNDRYATLPKPVRRMWATMKARSARKSQAEAWERMHGGKVGSRPQPFTKERQTGKEEMSIRKPWTSMQPFVSDEPHRFTKEEAMRFRGHVFNEPLGESVACLKCNQPFVEAYYEPQCAADRADGFDASQTKRGEP